MLSSDPPLSLRYWRSSQVPTMPQIGGVLDVLGTKIFVAVVCNADRLKWDVGGGLA